MLQIPRPAFWSGSYGLAGARAWTMLRGPVSRSRRDEVAADRKMVTADAASEDPRIFVHLPKTGGGSIAAMLRETPGVEVHGPHLFPPGARRGDGCRRVIVMGHLAFGYHALAGTRPLYCTVLREPMDRLISQVFYAAHAPQLYIPPEERMPAFLRWLDTLSHANYYCRLLSCPAYSLALISPDAGASSPRDVLVRMRERTELIRSVQLFEGTDPEADFGTARANLDAMFFFVGLFEQFEATVRRLFQALDLNVPTVRRVRGHRVHATLDRPRISDLPRDVRHRLEELTFWDRRLYDEVARHQPA